MKKIIIAEPIIRLFGKNGTVFSRGSISTLTAESSEEILHLHETHKADLIVTDSELPFMGGAKLCSTIRSNAGLKNVSIVMVCNNTDLSLAQCRAAGANSVIPRPADPGLLFAKISELLVVPQRKGMRVLQRIAIKGRGEDSVFTAQSLNISISGMLLETSRELKTGERLICTFNIAHCGITVECEVMRSDKTASGRRRYGVNFLNCDTKSLIIIDQYVKTQAKNR